MSVQAMSAAFKQSGIGPIGKFVLVALADDADPAGYVNVPAPSVRAERCGLAAKAVEREITALERAGLLIKPDGSGFSRLALPDLGGGA